MSKILCYVGIAVSACNKNVYDWPTRCRAAFEREVEGMPSIRSVGDLPQELHCPLCKEVMKDAVLTSKCCFSSYCDKCKEQAV